MFYLKLANTKPKAFIKKLTQWALIYCPTDLRNDKFRTFKKAIKLQGKHKHFSYNLKLNTNL